MNLRRSVAAGAVVAALLSLTLGTLAARASVLAAPAAALALVDHTPPKLTIEPYGRYLRGSQVNIDYDSEGFYDWYDAQYYLKWTASDPSGICSQTITEQTYDTLGGDPDPVLGGDTVTFPVPAGSRTYEYGTNLWDAGRITPRYVVRSTDCAGNTATSAISTTRFGALEDSSPSIAYTGVWKVAHFAGFTDGTTHYSNRAGDAFQVTGLPEGPLGLLMEAKADRGQVGVFVDGTLRATVDTGALGKQHRTVVWQIILKPGAAHTLRVVNKGTAGRPRVDLDVVLAGRTSG